MDHKTLDSPLGSRMVGSGVAPCITMCTDQLGRMVSSKQGRRETDADKPGPGRSRAFLRMKTYHSSGDLGEAPHCA